jgi:hypothetical protein
VNQDELNAALAASPSPDRVTPEYLASRIASVDFHRPTGTLTLCVITLDNGFTVTGESACADPANYRQDIGEKIARDMATAKLWPLLGFALKEAMAAREAQGVKVYPTIYSGWGRYRSHKVVEAAQIVGHGYPDAPVVYVGANGDPVSVPPEFFARGVPSRGDMLVRYQPDGYLSWSPAGKFLDGYADA